MGKRIYLSIGGIATAVMIVMFQQLGESAGQLQNPNDARAGERSAIAMTDNTVCWNDYHMMNMTIIACATNTAFCFTGWHQGSPSPQQCSFSLP
jgi:hypothetical protein